MAFSNRFALLLLLTIVGYTFTIGYRTISKLGSNWFSKKLSANLNKNNEFNPYVSSIQQNSLSNTKQFFSTVSILWFSFASVGKTFADDLDSYTDSLAVMIEAREIIKPTDTFIG